MVEIIRGGARHPHPGWEDLVITGRARAAIRRLIRESEHEEFKRIGRVIAEHAFLREGKSFRESLLEDVLAKLEADSLDALFIKLGRGQIGSNALIEAVFPGQRDPRRVSTGDKDLIRDDKAGLYVHGRGLTPGVSLHFAQCCSPIPGDRIVGLMAPGRGVEIHTIDCERLAEIEENGESVDWVDLRWTPEAAEHAVSNARILATVRNEPGVLAELAGAVGAAGGNIANVKTLSRSRDFFDMAFDVEVFDVRHLSNIVAALKTSDRVVSVERARAD